MEQKEMKSPVAEKVLAFWVLDDVTLAVYQYEGVDVFQWELHLLRKGNLESRIGYSSKERALRSFAIQILRYLQS